MIARRDVMAAGFALPLIRPKTYAQPINNAPTVLTVGPGKKLQYITDAGNAMWASWNPGTGSPRPLPELQPYHVIIGAAPDGYYDDDTGAHSKKWGAGKLRGWPPYEGNLFGPVIIEGEPGKPAPLLRCPTGGAGSLYYQQGWFNTFGADATFRHLRFEGCAAGEASGGIGTMSALRFNTNNGDTNRFSGNILVEDVEITGCDDGILGGSPGQTVTLRRLHLHHNGNGGGRVHNAYIGWADTLIVEDLLSTNCTIGHLLKSRATRTELRGSIRLIGNGGTESACLDVPSGGTVVLAPGSTVQMQKSPQSDAAWVWHYGGENHDADGGVPYHPGGAITIAGNLTMVSPRSLQGRQAATAPIGFANETGRGASGAADTQTITPQLTGAVSLYGIRADRAGLRATMLDAEPAFDLTSPVRA